MKLSRQRLPYVAMCTIVVVTFLSLYGAMRGIASEIEKEREGFQDNHLPFFPPQDDESEAPPKVGESNFFPKLPSSRGFECLLRTWESSLPIVSFFLLIFGSLLVSSEVASGTARTALQRPVRRVEFLLAKAIVLVVSVLVTAGFVGLFSVWCVHALVGFGDVTDLEWGKVFVTRTQMVRYILKLLPMLVVPLACAGFLGFFVSTFIGGPGASVGVAVITHYVLGSLLKIFKSWGVYYFDYYYRQGIDWLLQLSRGIKTDLPKMDAVGWTSMEYYVPAVFLLVFAGVPLIMFRRRDIVT